MGCRFMILLANARKVSNMGKPKAITGIKIESAVYDFKVPCIETIARVNPINADPDSPINIFAGLKLTGRKPRQAPASAAVIIPAYDPTSSASGLKRETARSVRALIVPIPEASPSRPSIILNALVNATIQNIVINNDETGLRRIREVRVLGFVKNSIREPDTSTAVIAAAI